ncbi:MAG: 2-hydroxyacyl-CoA dehydratase subunit D [Candidatus Aminicenantales bacterium]
MIERSIGWLLRRSLTYGILGNILKLYYARDENPAFRIWVSFLIRMCREAFTRSKPVIWTSAFVPTELVYGIGGVPIHPEILASVMAYFNVSGWFLEKSDTRVSTDLCSFYRIALGMTMAGFLPRPDLLLSSSLLCDGSNKFFGYISQIYDVPHLFIDVPYRGGKAGRRYLVDQLHTILDSMMRLTGISSTQARMETALDLSNQARRYLLQINELRKARPAPFLGSEALSFGAGMLFCSLGCEEGVRFYRALHRFIRNNVDQGVGHPPQQKYRLLWLHHIRPYYPNNIFDVLHERGAAVVFEETNHVYWPELRREEILDSLSEKMLSNCSNGPLDRRVENALRMARAYDVDGAIHFSHWGCRQSCGGAVVLAEAFKAEGIPCILLDGDGGDPSLYSPGQTQTRLEAFVEVLDQKGA